MTVPIKIEARESTRHREERFLRRGDLHQLTAILNQIVASPQRFCAGFPRNDGE